LLSIVGRFVKPSVLPDGLTNRPTKEGRLNLH
jgi:hypothetical protein